VGLINKIIRKWTGTNRSKKEEEIDNKPQEILNQNISVEKNVLDSKIYWSSLYKKEDWWAVWIGLIIFALSLPSYFGVYLLGWIPVAKPWTDISHALSTKVFDPWIGLVASFIFLAFIMLPVNRFNGVKSKDWCKGFL